MILIYFFNLITFIFILFLFEKLQCEKAKRKKLLTPNIKAHNLKKRLKNHCNKVKLKVFKQSFNFNGLQFFFDNKKIKNFKICFFNNKLSFVKFNNNLKLILTFNFNNKTLEIKCKTLKQCKLTISQILLNEKINFKTLNKKTIIKIKQLICGEKITLINNYNLLNSQTFVVPLFAKNILYKNKPTKKSAKLINKNINNFIVKDNYVLINNFNNNLNFKNIKTLFHFKINSIKCVNGKFIVNNNFVVQQNNNSLKIFKIGCFTNFLNNNNFKVETTNEELNLLINKILPEKIEWQYKKNFCFIPLNFFIKNVSLQFYYKQTIKLLYFAKKFIELNNFLFNEVLGLNLLNNAVKFLNPKFFIGKFKLIYNNNVFIVNNTIYEQYVVFNNIIYKNVNVIKLSNNNHLKIEKTI